MQLILLYSFLLFLIIFLAVRLAINPLLDKQDDANTDKDDDGLVQLRDIGILSNSELEEIIELYQRKRNKKHENEQYQKYEMILEELKVMGYYSDEQYTKKINKLRKHFHID